MHLPPQTPERVGSASSDMGRPLLLPLRLADGTLPIGACRDGRAQRLLTTTAILSRNP